MAPGSDQLRNRLKLALNQKGLLKGERARRAAAAPDETAWWISCKRVCRMFSLASMKVCSAAFRDEFVQLCFFADIDFFL
jgi:hypothetical protein